MFHGNGFMGTDGCRARKEASFPRPSPVQWVDGQPVYDVIPFSAYEAFLLEIFKMLEERE